MFIYIVVGVVALVAILWIMLSYTGNQRKLRGDRELAALEAYYLKAKILGSPERTKLQVVNVDSYEQFFADLGFKNIAHTDHSRDVVRSLNEIRKSDGDFNQRLPVFTTAFNLWGARNADSDVFALGKNLCEAYRNFLQDNKARLITEYGINISMVQVEMKQYHLACLKPLLELAETDYHAFKEAQSLIRFRSEQVDESYPDNWYQLVATHVRTPSLYDFGITNSNHFNVGFGDAELLLMAAEALDERNMTKAKLVMAYAYSATRLRNELGDIFVTDLAKLIAKLERAKTKPVVGTE